MKSVQVKVQTGAGRADLKDIEVWADAPRARKGVVYQSVWKFYEKKRP